MFRSESSLHTIYYETTTCIYLKIKVGGEDYIYLKIRWVVRVIFQVSTFFVCLAF